MVSLDGAQAALSWITILKRRHSYRVAFDQFDQKTVRGYDEIKIQSLLQNEVIIRNKLKVRSVVTNAEAFLRVQEEFGSFGAYMWQFTDGKPLINKWERHADVPASTVASERMSRDLRKQIGRASCREREEIEGDAEV